MGEVWGVLGTTWRRYWGNPMAWAWPFGAGLIVIVTIIVWAFLFSTGSAFLSLLGLLGLLVLLFFIWAGFMGVFSAVTATGRAVWDDFMNTGRKYFWRVAGLTMLFGLAALITSSVLAAIMGAPPGGYVRLAWMQTASPLFGIAIQAVPVLLFAFAPAAIAVDGLSTSEAIGRGLRFLATRPQLGLGILLVGFVIAQGPGLMAGAAFSRSLQTLSSQAIDPVQAMTVLLGASALGLALLVYSGFAMPFLHLTLFTGYAWGRPVSAETPGGVEAPVTAPGPADLEA